MSQTSSQTNVTPLMIFYGLFAAAGAVIPWYFNIRFMVETETMLTPQVWIAGGFIDALRSSITSDFLIGTLPVLVWMIVEAQRLGMRHLWFYVVTTFLVAFAFACPLFLLMREIRLQALRTESQSTALTGNPDRAEAAP
jgi:hypothetical protein